jgi:hypothetical protein
VRVVGDLSVMDTTIYILISFEMQADRSGGRRRGEMEKTRNATLTWPCAAIAEAVVFIFF